MLVLQRFPRPRQKCQSVNLKQQIRWAGGQSDQDKLERGASVSPTVLAVCGEPLTTPKQLTLF